MKKSRKKLVFSSIAVAAAALALTGCGPKQESEDVECVYGPPEYFENDSYDEEIAESTDSAESVSSSEEEPSVEPNESPAEVEPVAVYGPPLDK